MPGRSSTETRCGVLPLSSILDGEPLVVVVRCVDTHVHIHTVYRGNTADEMKHDGMK